MVQFNVDFTTATRRKTLEGWTVSRPREHHFRRHFVNRLIGSKCIFLFFLGFLLFQIGRGLFAENLISSASTSIHDPLVQTEPSTSSDVASLSDQLRKLLPSGVSITEIKRFKDKEIEKIWIKGHSETSDKIFNFLKAISSSGQFKSPSLESTEEIPIDQVRYFVRFTMDAIEVPSSPKTK